MSYYTHDKSYQLKLNNMNYHINCHTGFSTNFGSKFSVPSIILVRIIKE